MRKRSLLICSSLVLLGVVAVQGQAAWAKDPEPDCAGKQPGIQGFHFGTVPAKARVAASPYGGGALCGTDVRGPTKELYGAYLDVFLLTPPGVTLRCANPEYPDNGHRAYCSGTDLPSETNVGSSGVDVLVCLFPAGQSSLARGCDVSEMFVDIYVNQSPGAPKNDRCNFSKVIWCLQSAVPFGYGNITVEPCWLSSRCKPHDPLRNRYAFHIFPITTPFPGSAYYTEIGEPDYNHSSEPDPRDFQLDDSTWTNGEAGTYERGACMHALGTGTLKGVPRPRCYPVTWTP